MGAFDHGADTSRDSPHATKSRNECWSTHVIPDISNLIQTAMCANASSEWSNRTTLLYAQVSLQEFRAYRDIKMRALVYCTYRLTKKFFRTMSRKLNTE